MVHPVFANNLFHCTEWQIKQQFKIICYSILLKNYVGVIRHSNEFHTLLKTAAVDVSIQTVLACSKYSRYYSLSITSKLNSSNKYKQFSSLNSVLARYMSRLISFVIAYSR